MWAIAIEKIQNNFFDGIGGFVFTGFRGDFHVNHYCTPKTHAHETNTQHELIHFLRGAQFATGTPTKSFVPFIGRLL